MPTPLVSQFHRFWSFNMTVTCKYGCLWRPIYIDSWHRKWRNNSCKATCVRIAMCIVAWTSYYFFFFGLWRRLLVSQFCRFWSFIGLLIANMGATGNQFTWPHGLGNGKIVAANPLVCTLLSGQATILISPSPLFAHLDIFYCHNFTGSKVSIDWQILVPLTSNFLDLMASEVDEWLFLFTSTSEWAVGFVLKTRIITLNRIRKPKSE